MKRLVIVVIFCLLGLIGYSQCTTYNSGSTVNFNGTCTENTDHRNKTNNGVLYINGTLTFDGYNFRIFGPVVVNGTLIVTTGNIAIYNGGSLTVSNGGTVTTYNAFTNNGGVLTINNGGTMTVTNNYVNDFSGSNGSTTTVNGTMNVNGTFYNQGDGTIAGGGTINGDIEDSGTSTFTGDYSGDCTGNCNGVLPVTYLDISIQDLGSACQLTWTTATEINNKGFYVQRKLGGALEFATLHFEDGHGTSTEKHSYEFVDTENPENAYYRLLQVDFDGKSEFSETLFYSREQVSPPIRVYPNPVDGEVQFQNWDETPKTLTLISGSGKVILSGTFDSQDVASGAVTSKLSELGAGVYHISISDQRSTSTIRVLKN